MTNPRETEPGRLDSWKAIAAYLNRSERTVRRWERELGLPVRRLSARPGGSVFAYAAEIDAWLKRTGAGDLGEPDDGRWVRRLTGLSSNRYVRLVSAVAATIVLVLLIRSRMPATAADNPTIDLSPLGASLIDGTGARRWRYTFDPAYVTFLPVVGGPHTQIMRGTRPAVFVHTSHRERRSDNALEGGELLQLTMDGRRAASFTFDDRVSFGGVTYGPPWCITAIAADDRGGARRIVVAAHHYQWSASLVTVLDEDFNRLGTFVHSGWIEWTRWLSPDRLLIAGYSNAHSGGMMALLDPASLNGRAPEPPGTEHYCDDCDADARPIKMVVMPRTEVNLASQSGFNRALVTVTSDVLTASTVEVPPLGFEVVDVIYEFTRSLQLARATQSSRYWAMHRVLEDQGRLHHSRGDCPDRHGPRTLVEWTPDSGWQTVPIPAHQRDTW